MKTIPCISKFTKHNSFHGKERSTVKVYRSCHFMDHKNFQSAQLNNRNQLLISKRLYLHLFYLIKSPVFDA